MGAFLTYALDESGSLVHVDNVCKGLKCACRCPSCNSLLYAKNAGKRRMHHFAHAHGHECKGAYESSLHHLAKIILMENGIIMPPVYYDSSFPSGPIHIHDVEIEKYDKQYHIKPDAEGIMDNGERLLIEFCVSHKIDEQKRNLIIDNHLKCIEININYQPLEISTLKKFLTEEAKDRQWVLPISSKPTKESNYSQLYVSNPVYDKARTILKTIFDKKTILLPLYVMPNGNNDEPFNIKELGYTERSVIKKYLGIKSDLLLFNNNERYAPLSINIRGRRRHNNFQCPKGIYIIDIILKSADNENIIKEKLNNGDLSGYGLSLQLFGTMILK